MIISRTPLRVAFLGGGTDYPEWFLEHGGAVLSTAIDKYCYVSLHNGKVSVSFDLSTGAGLGTSSAYTVGLLRLCSRFGQETLAQLAIVWERDKLEGNIGYQDQYLCALGGFHLMRFFRSGITDYHVKYDGHFTDYLMLVDTGHSRQAGKIVADQLRRVKQNEQALIQIKKMVDEGCKYVESGAYAELGLLLNEAWKLKKSLSPKITTEETDWIYQTALKAGAVGGKLLGAGGGGFMVFLVEPDKKEFVRQALRLKDIPFLIDEEGSKIVYDDSL